MASQFCGVCLSGRLTPFKVGGDRCVFLVGVYHSPNVLRSSLVGVFCIRPDGVMQTITTLRGRKVVVHSPGSGSGQAYGLCPARHTLSMVSRMRAMYRGARTLLLRNFERSSGGLFVSLLVRTNRGVATRLHVREGKSRFGS